MIQVKGRLQSYNLWSTELFRLLEWVQFQVQQIRVAPRIYERVQPNLSLTRDICRSPNFTISYWLTELSVDYAYAY